LVASAPAAGVGEHERASHPSTLADPLTFDPAKLSLAFGVYCYFVLDPGSIADEQLSPEMHEALKALGYIE